MKLLLKLFLFVLALSACNTDKSVGNTDISVKWKCIANNFNDGGKTKAAFTITNNSDKPLDKDWALYFNFCRKIDHTYSSHANVEHVNGDFFKLTPTSSFKPLKKGESTVVEVRSESWVIKLSDAPNGLYIISGKDTIIVKDVTYEPFSKPEQYNRSKDDIVPIPTAESRFHENKRLNSASQNQSSVVIPKPLYSKKTKGSFTIKKNTVIVYNKELSSEAKFLANAIKKLTGHSLKLQTKRTSKSSITLEKKNFNVDGIVKDAYKVNVTNSNITISGSDKGGVLYGVQTLRALFPVKAYENKQNELTVNSIEIKDAPVLQYRGIHYDDARNFRGLKSTLRLLDLMSFYKLNKLHFHITDDEGWRIEIPEIPELTEIGAFRPHGDDPYGMIPHYGSGPFKTNKSGNGYYTREDYIKILKYATERNIEVIPEIDLPGHARAAIVSMKARYKKYKAKNNMKKAEEFLLSDLNDKSEYMSVQNFRDNVICIVRESSYNFIETVVKSMNSMYKEANAPFTTVHTGGDEVPHGVWEKSPTVIDFFKADNGVSDINGLKGHFIKRFDKILKKYNLKTAGWEEIAMKTIKKNGVNKHVPNLEFSDKGFVPFIWNNMWGWGAEDMGNKLANAGYPVVFCSVTNLYLDMAYTKEDAERGYYWGAFVDTRKIWECTPYDFLMCADKDYMGKKLDLSKFKDMVHLTKKGRKNILGIQAQLWSETYEKAEHMEYMAFPKIIGFAERAWHPEPKWSTLKTKALRDKAYLKEWGQFAYTVGTRELPRLSFLVDNWNFRIPLPGAIIKDGVLNANVIYPTSVIRYTTDGTEPNVNSPVYKKPVKTNGKTVKLKTFMPNGRFSRTSTVK